MQCVACGSLVMSERPERSDLSRSWEQLSAPESLPQAIYFILGVALRFL